MNLFAQTLQAVLDSHGKPMTALYALRGTDGEPLIAPAKVARLQRSLTEDVTAVLSEPELAALAGALALEPEEERRLRAALFGEAIRKLLAGRVSRLSALREAARIAALLVDEEEDEESLRAELAADPHVPSILNQPSADVNAAITRALEPIAESCEQGELWIAAALATPFPDQREDLLRTAWSALGRAGQLLALAPAVAQNSPIQAEWRRAIERAVATIRQIRPME